MAWLAVDIKGGEGVFNRKPHRVDGFWYDSSFLKNDSEVFLSKGSIEKLIGKTLTWEDEPVEIK